MLSGDPVSVDRDIIIKLLELLQLAARRGAFEISEYAKIGDIYDSVSAKCSGQAQSNNGAT